TQRPPRRTAAGELSPAPPEGWDPDRRCLARLDVGIRGDSPLRQVKLLGAHPRCRSTIRRRGGARHRLLEDLMPRILLSALVAVLGLAACTDASRVPTEPDSAEPAVGRRAAERVTASGLWNQRTRAIIGRQKVGSNASARLYAI